jgi:hypothetical protein
MGEIATDALEQWGVPALIALGSAAFIVIALVVGVRLARRGKRARNRAERALEDLGSLIVRLDDATEELELEIGMSSALYDGRPPASLRRARLTAQHTRDDAFAAYSAVTADGTLPTHQLTESKRLTEAVQKALDIIDRARAENEAWLAENSTTVEQVAVARQRLDELAARMGDPTALRQELARIADESEWEDAADADTAARDALEEARTHLRSAEEKSEDPSLSAREDLTACEKALARAEKASQLLEETHRLVQHATLAVDDEQKGAAAGTQLATDPEHAPKLAEAIRVASAALDSAMQIAPRRPVAANERIARLRDRLDIALADARTQQQRLRGARSALPGSLAAARSALARAEAVVTGAEVDARVRLDSAHRELAFARQAQDPIEALDASRRARRDAEEATVLAKDRKRRR